MKVGIYLANLCADDGGGYTFITDLIDALYKKAYESQHTFIIFTSSKKVMEQELYFEHEKIEVQVVPITTKIIYKIFQASRRIFSTVSPLISAKIFPNPLDRFVKKHKIDIFWFPTPYIVEINVPYLITIWDLQHRLQPFFPEVRERGIWECRELAYSNSLKRASFVIVGSKTGQKEVENFYQVPSERIKILPHPTPGFSLNAPYHKSYQLIRKFNIPKGYLFYPAQFWPHKNHINLLHALSILRKKYGLSLPLVLVGSDKGNKSYIKRKVIEMELDSEVYFLGFVSKDELNALYINSLALTYLSFFGPENLPPLEAFALGTPVIASNISGAKEQLGEAALLVDPKNPEEIADAIYSIYNDPKLRNKLIDLGKKRAYHWTAQDFIRGVFSLLDDFVPIRWCWE